MSRLEVGYKLGARTVVNIGYSAAHPPLIVKPVPGSLASAILVRRLWKATSSTSL